MYFQYILSQISVKIKEVSFHQLFQDDLSILYKLISNIVLLPKQSTISKRDHRLFLRSILLLLLLLVFWFLTSLPMTSALQSSESSSELQLLSSESSLISEDGETRTANIHINWKAAPRYNPYRSKISYHSSSGNKGSSCSPAALIVASASMARQTIWSLVLLLLLLLFHRKIFDSATTKAKRCNIFDLFHFKK